MGVRDRRQQVPGRGVPHAASPLKAAAFAHMPFCDKHWCPEIEVPEPKIGDLSAAKPNAPASPRMLAAGSARGGVAGHLSPEIHPQDVSSVLDRADRLDPDHRAPDGAVPLRVPVGVHLHDMDIRPFR